MDQIKLITIITSKKIEGYLQ